MPGNPLTPGKAARHRGNTDSLTGSSPLDVYDTDSVKDRIRKWQAQGGGVITAPDIYFEDEQDDTSNDNAIRASPIIESSSFKADYSGSPQSRSSRQRTRPDEQEDRRDRSKSAPAKRVVSDAHWRKDRSPPKHNTSPKTPRKTTPKTIRNVGDGSVGERAISTSKKGNFRHTAKHSKETSKDEIPRWTKKAKAVSKRHSGQDLNSYISSQKSASATEDNTPVSQKSRSPAPNDTTKSRSRSKTARSSAWDSTTNTAHIRKQSNNVSSNVNSEQGSSSERGAVPQRREIKKNQNGIIFNQALGGSITASTNLQAVPIETPRVTSVQAWLNSTPDPFVDDGEALDKGTPSQSVQAEPHSPAPEPALISDPNRIWDTIEPKDRARSGVHASRRRKRIPSSAIYQGNPFPANFEPVSELYAPSAGPKSAPKLLDLVGDAADLSPALTRRGARKQVLSSKRNTTSKLAEEDPQEGDIMSALSTNLTGSSIEGFDFPAPLRPPGLQRRPFPSTGRHRLSTIASVDTFDSNAHIPEIKTAFEPPEMEPQAGVDDSEVRRAGSGHQFDINSLGPSQDHLTKHSDLISILSKPEPGTRSMRSVRSIRTNRSRLATATIGDLMTELASDENKYMRELRTLVDGVVPVLLTCVLSRSDSAVAAGLFHPNHDGQEDPNFTKPIVDMGIALERLRSLHRRIPMQDPKSLLTWAQGAQRAYAEYLRAWRMGFQDVIVNLAPANENQTENDGGPKSGIGCLDDGLPVNKDGDVVNGNGERVDVAFLLKRPLVRLKYLAKTLKGLNVISPSAEAETLAIKYQNLVIAARNRSNEERARLEDEAAANIDATRARDLKTLAPSVGVSIDRNRRVRARDQFNLALQHSSGQRIDCQIELLLRDDVSASEGSGDLLICDVDGTGRWLLFPPIQHGRVSARNGDSRGEIIVMIRGLNGTGTEWHEVLSMRSDDEQAGFEWVQMLGLTPVPPTILRTQSFLTKHKRKDSDLTQTRTLETPATENVVDQSRTPSPRGVEVPIGEQAVQASRVRDDTKRNETEKSLQDSVVRSKKLQRRSRDSSSHDMGRSLQTYVNDVTVLRSVPNQASEKALREQEPIRRPRSFKEALGLSGTSTNSMGLKRTRAQKLPGHHGSSRILQSPTIPRSNLSTPKSPPSSLPDTQKSEKWRENGLAADHSGNHQEREDFESCKDGVLEVEQAIRPEYHRSPSSMPSLELPVIPKIRKDSPPTTPITEPEEEPQWCSPAESKLPFIPLREVGKRSESHTAKVDPVSPSSLGCHPSSSPEAKHAKSHVFSSSTTHVPHRRSSSPLKHEYEPSTASESDDSEASTVEHHDVSSVSSSDSDDLEVGDNRTPLMPLGAVSRASKLPSHGSLYSIPNGTLGPSESASQAPYKKVPPQPTKASKTIASIFSWSDTGSWESLHPDECSIMITPGLIEAYEMSAAHSTSTPLSSSTPVEDVDAFSESASNITAPEDVVKNARPLVALELTPLVPLRRGTAIDISIRSPPTSNSQITSGNNIMFRSRNPEECEALYALINYARIHNPTYIALQNARGPFDAANGLDRRASTRASGSRSSSWFNGWGGSSGYRVSSAPTPSIAPSESSIGSMSSAFSALKRFGRGGGGMFNIARSTISSREGSRANSIYTSSDNSSGSGASSPFPLGIQGDPHGQIGLSNTKIRLYFRETQTRWRDMGSARLTIMRPPVPDLCSGTSASGESVSRPARQGADGKRIVVRGKTKGEILLDATLGETCFERVGRQGIAVSVWEDIVGPNGEVGTVGAVGGVGAGRAKVYMIRVSLQAFHLALNLSGC
ncbi:MAG: hypothetical protein Q9219_006973 [cf. Caloplaca sp. 3 TL-2023]